MEKRALKGKIGFFGGTFDPIHYGHIHMALQLMERAHLDTVLFCPTSLSPFKQDAFPLVSAKLRLEMVRLAIAPIEKFAALDLEVGLKVPAFTIDTMRRLVTSVKKEGDAAQFFLLLSQDALPRLHEWKEVDDLLVLAHPLIASRTAESVTTKNLSQSASAAVSKGIIQTPILDISSTEIRNRLAASLYCGHLVPQDVLDYIRGNELY